MISPYHLNSAADMFFIYNLLLLLLYPLLFLATLFSDKLRRNWQIRKIPFKVEAHGRPVIWFHAASVGEFEQARVVAQFLKEKYPNVFLFFTVYSYSAYSQRQNDPLPDLLVALPFDFPWRMKKLLQQVQPRTIVYAKYDVWPNLARLAAKANIPQYLISATLPATSQRRGILGRKFFSKIYSYLTGIYSIHPEHTARFAEYGLNAITSGDTRFEAARDRITRCPAALKRQIAQLKKSIPSHMLVMTAGSTYETSERLLVDVLSRYNSLFVIMAPHHVNREHISKIEDLLQDKNISFAKYSQIVTENLHTIKKIRLLLIDTTGVLPYLYGLADIAYVGGGFEGSLHSILEPALFSLPIITGPAIANSQEALDLRQIELLYVMPKPEPDHIISFCQHYSSAKARKKTNAAIARYYSSRLGATKTILPVLEQAAQLIPSDRKSPQKKTPPPSK